MARTSDVVIGLDLGEESLHVAAFTCDGRLLGEVGSRIAVRKGADGAAEVELGAVWQATVGAMVRLGARLPDLARRVVALAITGAAGGAFLIDEDGDQVAPALLGRDRRAGAIAEAWWQRGVGDDVRKITGWDPGAGLQSAQLAWLVAQRPDAIDAATTALHGKGWLYYCCTGERRTDRVEAAASFGDFRSGAYDERVLALLGLDDLRRLLPEIGGIAEPYDGLHRAAAAAMGLAVGTPVVLAPPDRLSAALAAGLTPDESGMDRVGVTIYGPQTFHLRAHPRTEGVELPMERASGLWPEPAGEGCHGVAAGSLDTTSLDWLVGLAAELVADAGLIGIGQAEVAAILERKAAHAPPATLLFHPVPSGSTPSMRNLAGMIGLGGGTTAHDLMRAIHEGLALSARHGHEALGQRPTELRLVASAEPSALGRRILASAMGAPVRPLERSRPAAAGAALLAMVALGHYERPRDGFATWVAPHLGEPEAVDPDLEAVYDQLFEAFRRSQCQSSAVGG